MPSNPQVEELALRLMKQGLARTHLDAMRMAESMSGIRTGPDDATLRAAEKFYVKGQPNEMNLNIRPTEKRDFRFAPASAPTPQPVIRPVMVPAAQPAPQAELAAIRQQLDSQAATIAQMQAQIADLMERMNRVLPPSNN